MEDHSYRNRRLIFLLFHSANTPHPSIGGIRRYLLMANNSVGDCERETNLEIVIITYNEMYRHVHRKSEGVIHRRLEFVLRCCTNRFIDYELRTTLNITLANLGRF